MSLKSKLEAVIYAAEEPVTLGQLATLFGAEALEWRAEQEAAAAEQAAEASGSPSDPAQSVIAEGLEYLDLRNEDGSLLEQPGFAITPSEPLSAPSADQQAQERAEAAEPGGAESQVIENAEESPGEAPQTGPGDSTAPEPDPADGAQPETAPLDPEAEAKRIARQRDRDIKTILRQLIDELIVEYANDERGIEIREIAGGYRMATKPECHDAVRMFIKSLKPPLKLSLPALETLAVIAYKQPVTAPEVNEIRGVDSSGVFGSLLARKLISTAGRKQVIGRPILYKTTKEFLMRFGLKDVSELPSMDEFEKMASELEETEPAAAETGSDAELTEGAEAGESALADQDIEQDSDELSQQPEPAETASESPSEQENTASPQEATDAPIPAPENLSAQPEPSEEPVPSPENLSAQPEPSEEPIPSPEHVLAQDEATATEDDSAAVDQSKSPEPTHEPATDPETDSAPPENTEDPTLTPENVSESNERAEPAE